MSRVETESSYPAQPHSLREEAVAHDSIYHATMDGQGTPSAANLNEHKIKVYDAGVLESHPEKFPKQIERIYAVIKRMSEEGKDAEVKRAVEEYLISIEDPHYLMLPKIN